MLTYGDVWWQEEDGRGLDKKDERDEKKEDEKNKDGNEGENGVLSCTHLRTHRVM
jgi:hypothetical protein